MPLRAVCPECGATKTLDNDYAADDVECRRCGIIFPTPEAPRPGPPPLPKSLVASQGADSAGGFEILDDEDADDGDDVLGAFRTKRRPARDEDEDEEDERPRSKRRPRDDDGVAAPRRSRLPAKRNTALFVAVGLGACLLLGGAVSAAVFFLWKEDSPAVAQGPFPDPVVIPGPGGDPGPGGPVKPIDPVPPNVPEKPDELAVQPAQFAGERITVNLLPGHVTDVCAGAGGHYFFLHLAAERKLLVLDPAKAVIVKEIGTSGADTLIAAGATKLLLLDTAEGSLRRFDLRSLLEDKTAKLPFTGPIISLALGSASAGPALVVGGPGLGWPVHFIDIETLGPADVGWAAALPNIFPRTVRFRAAPNGHRWAGTAAGTQTVQGAVIELAGKRLTALPVLSPPGYAALSADGAWLFSRSHAQPAGGLTLSEPRTDERIVNAPALHGPFYVDVRPAGVGAAVVVRDRARDRELAVRSDLPFPYEPGRGDLLTPDQHLHFIPDAHVLLLIPPAADRVLLIKLDLAAELVKIPEPMAFVTSTPPTDFAPGVPLTYRVKVLSNAGSPAFSVHADVPGMTVSPGGDVRWTPSADESLDRVEFTVTAKATRATATQTVVLYNSAAKTPKPIEPKVGPKIDPKVDPKVSPPVAPAILLVTAIGPVPPIQPPMLADATMEAAIPGPVKDVCVGGGGRYLILHCPTVRKLAIFDANTAQVVKSLPTTADDVLIAAGADKLLVVYPGEKTIERWSLTTFDKEATGQIESRQKVIAVAMGNATAGPLVLGGPPSQNNASRMALTFIDLPTLKEVKIDKANGALNVGFGTAANLRASADGRTLGAWYANLLPSGIQVVTLAGNTLTGAHAGESVGHIVPGPDGQTIFTEKGRYTAAAKPIGESRDAVLPALQGTGWVTISKAAEGKPAIARRVTVRATDAAEPAIVFDDLPGFDGRRDPFDRDTAGLPFDKRLFYIPAAKILVVVPTTADKLHVYKVGPS